MAIQKPERPEFAEPDELREIWEKLLAEQMPYLSSTSARMMRRCPEQFRRRYILGEKVPPPINMIAGKADHAGIKESMTQKLVTGSLWGTSDVLDVAEASYQEQAEEAGGIYELDYGQHAERGASKKAKAAAFDKVRSWMLGACGLYHDVVCPRIEPQTVEGRFEVELETLPVPVIGYLDLETERAIRERKTGATIPSQPKGDWLTQASIYQLAVPKPVVWDLSRRSQNPDVREHAFDLPYLEKRRAVTIRMLANTAGLIADCMSRYGPYEPWPDATDHGWACNYCGWGPNATNVCQYPHAFR
jgi:hypothetical protein